MKRLITHSLMLLTIMSISFVKKGLAQTVLLYQNSFESPLVSPSTGCSPDLDQTLVNTLWGGTGLGTGGGGLFQQYFTVETILINGSNNQYTDILGLGGNYCLGMLSNLQNDKLALILNSQMLPYANISFLISPIDLPQCGGPFGLDTAVMHLLIYDSPGGSFSFSTPGTLLAQDTVLGSFPGLTPFTFNWFNASSSLDISNSVDGNITIVFDLITSGYAAIDSLVITSSAVPTSIHEQNEVETIVAFPNPFTNQLTVSLSYNKQTTISLYDFIGREILQQTFTHRTIINTEKFPDGIYFYELRNDKGAIKTGKVVKQ